MPDTQTTPPTRLSGRDVIYVTLIGAALTAVGIAILLGLAGDLAVRPSGPRPLNLGVLFGSIVVLNSAIAAAVGLILIRKRRMTWRKIGFGRPNVHWVFASILLGCILVATIEGIERVFDLSTGNLTAGLIAPDGFSWFGLLGGVVLVGFLAPAGEELYFRGLIYRWLRDQWGPAPAAPLSALLFAGAHFYYPLPHMLLVALLGLVLAIAYERSGSLWVPIGIHAAQNTTVVILIYWALA